MLAEMRARNLIEQAVVQVCPPLLLDAFEIARTLNEPATPFEPGVMQALPSPELPVLIAEAALSLSHPARTEDDAIAHRIRTEELANTALQMFLGTEPVPNQFLARAYLAQAELASRWSAGRKGDGLTDAVLKSLDFVMRALTLAQTSPARYQFLIYNASVAYWRCSRPIQRKGYFQHVLPSMPLVFDAIKGLSDEDAEWKAMFAIVLARAYDAESQQPQAIEVLNAVSGFALSDNLKIQVMRMLVHSSSGAQGAAMADTPRLQLHIEVQKVRSGVTPADEATLNGLLENEAIKEDTRLHSEIGRIALLNGLMPVAETCAKAIESNKDAGMSATVLCECTRSELNVLGLGEEVELYTKKMVDTRVGALQRLDKALITAIRANDPEVIHEVCALAWTLALPVLQPNLRKQAKRTLQSCSKALEDIRSPLHELRAQLHLEVARCDIADDLYAAAAIQVQKGLALDYSAPEDRIVEYNRPYDLHLNLLHKKLSMKMSLYAAPERPEDKAMLVIEQAREAHDKSLKISLLERAAGMLIKVDPPVDRPEDEVPIPELNEEMDPAFLKRGVRKERAMLWADIALIAWQALNSKMTLEAAEEAIGEEADPAKDRGLCIAQAQVHFAKSEAMFMKLKEVGFEPGRPLPDVAANLKANTALAAWVKDQRTKVISGFVAGMRLGRQVNEDWLCINAAAYLWNYHLPLFRGGELTELYEALEETVATLLLCTTKDAMLFSSIADGLARALEQRNASGQDALYPPENIEDAPALGDSTCLGHGQAVCKAAINDYDPAKMTPMTSKRAAATLARLQYVGSGGGSGVVLEDKEETQVIMLLEVMALDKDGKAGWVEKAMGLLPSCPNNPELFALLGQEAYDCGRFPESMLACKRAVATVGKIARPIPRLWRWFALAEVCHGRALVAQIDPKKHDMASQDHLKQEAISHFVQASQYAGQVPSENLITVAAQAMWNTAVSFMSTAAARQTIFESVEAVIKALTKVKVADDSDDTIKAFRTKFYVLLLESLSDAARWNDGLDATAKALKVLPPSCHKDLWDFRITFLGKMGKDTTAEMLKVKESGEEMVARVWTILAQSSSDKKGKLQAYYKAVEVLEQKPLAQVEYLVLYGEFLYTEGFPIEDAQDQLIAAADALLELDTALADEEEASLQSGSQSDSRSQSSSSSSFFKPPSTAPRAPTAKSSKSAATRSSRTGSTAASTVAGSGGRPPALNVGHLQELGRIYIMIAKMAKTRKEAIDNLIVAQHYLTRIFAMSVKTINEQLEVKLVPEGESPPAKIEIPTDLQGWIGFDFSDETCALFMADKGKEKNVMNKRTSKKPFLLLYYLDYCISALMQHGVQLPCVPVLRLYIFMAKYVVKSEDLEVLARLREAQLYQDLGLATEAEQVRVKIGSLALTQERERLLGEIVRQRESQKAKAGVQSKDPTGVKGGEQKSKAPKKPHRSEFDKPADGSAPGANGKYVKFLRPRTNHEIWVQQAGLKIKEGDFVTGRSLLQRTLKHCKAFEDTETEAMTLHLLARLAFLEGQCSQAIQLEQEGQTFTNEFHFWCESCISMADYVLEESQTKLGASTADDAVKALEKAVDVFAMVLEDNPNLGFEIAMLRARMKIKHGEVAALEANRQNNLGSVMWKKLHESGLQKVREAVDILRSLGGGPLLVDAMLMQARLECEPVSKIPAERQKQLSASLATLIDAEMQALECSTIARPANLRPDLRLAADERLAKVKLMQSQMLAGLAHEERFHPWALKPRPEIPAFPTVEGRDAEPIKEFLDPVKDLPDGGEDPLIRREEMALLSATAASQLTKDAGMRSDALAVLGFTLRIAADKAGQTERLWPIKPAPPRSQPSTATIGSRAAGQTLAEETVSEEPEGGEGEEAPPPVDPALVEPEGENLLKPAREALETALAQALAAQNVKAAGKAAGALCVCIGDSNPALAAELLNVYQSCKVEAQLRKVLLAALPPDSAERVVIRKLDYLASGGSVPSMSKTAEKALNFLYHTSMAIKRLKVDFRLAEVRETLDPTVCVVTLSVEQGYEGVLLWASWFVGGAPAEDEAMKLGPQVGRFVLDSALFSSLQTDATLLRTKQRRKHIDVGYSDDGLSTRELALRIVDGTNELFSALLQVIKAYLALHEDKGLDSLVLICDQELCALPIESCHPLCTAFPAIARDFSLAMHMHRHASKEAIDKGSMRYIVDPRNEDIEAGSVGTVKRPDFTTICAAFEADLQGSFADGVIGADHIPSKAELQRNISGASLFLYQGLGTLLSHMSPGLVSTLNLDKCQCVVLLDRAENEVAERRQNKLDTTVLPTIVQLRGMSLCSLCAIYAALYIYTYIHIHFSHTLAHMCLQLYIKPPLRLHDGLLATLLTCLHSLFADVQMCGQLLLCCPCAASTPCSSTSGPWTLYETIAQETPSLPTGCSVRVKSSARHMVQLVGSCLPHTNNSLKTSPTARQN